MSAILLNYTFQTSSPFIETAINELLRQRVIVIRARLPVSAVPQFQTVIAIHSLLQGFPHCVIYQVRVWTVCWSHRRLYKGDFLLCRYLTVFTVRRRAVLLQKHVVELISVVLS